MEKGSKSFYDFIVPEIPNIVQIIGIPLLLRTLLTNNSFIGFIISVVTGILLLMYLLNKSFAYLEKSSLYNENWRYKLFSICIVCAVVIFLILVGEIIEGNS